MLFHTPLFPMEMVKQMQECQKETILQDHLWVQWTQTVMELQENMLFLIGLITFQWLMVLVLILTSKEVWLNFIHFHFLQWFMETRWKMINRKDIVEYVVDMDQLELQVAL